MAVRKVVYSAGSLKSLPESSQSRSLAPLQTLLKILFQRVNLRWVSFLRHAKQSHDEQLLLERDKARGLCGEPSVLGRLDCACSSHCGGWASVSLNRAAFDVQSPQPAASLQGSSRMIMLCLSFEAVCYSCWRGKRACEAGRQAEHYQYPTAYMTHHDIGKLYILTMIILKIRTTILQQNIFTAFAIFTLDLSHVFHQSSI